MKAITDIRRENLQRWIDEKYNGVQAGFVAFTEINQGELSALLKNKSFGGGFLNLFHFKSSIYKIITK